MTIHNISDDDTGSGAPIAVSPDEWRIVRSLLRKHLPDCEVWAFGSRAGGQPKPLSDLDLALIAERPIGLGVLAALAEVFSESDLPWRVELVEWAATSERFRDIIRTRKVVIQQPVGLTREAQQKPRETP
jgi:predicted nucleotidyltransferase